MNFCKMCGEPLKGAGATATPPVGSSSPPLPASPSSTSPGNISPVVAPAKVARASLPSALAAVVGSGTTPRKPIPTPQSGSTLRRPMVAAPPAAAADTVLPPSSSSSSPPARSPTPAPTPSSEKPAALANTAKPFRLCATCNATTPAGFSFCQQCGARFDGEPSGETRAQSPSNSSQSLSVAPTVTDAVADTLSAESDIVPLVKKRTPSLPAPSVAPAPFARLVSVQRDGSDGQLHMLVEDVTDVGRTEGTLTFEDRFLAPRHARIERRAAASGSGPGVVLLPLDMLNGVFVRLRPTEAYTLIDGDVLLIGKEVLRFEVIEPEERALGPCIQHGVRLFGSPVRAPWARLRQIVQTGASRDIYHLVAAQVVLGREEGDVRFSDDEFMSRRHARIVNRDGRYEITDLESSNGTFVRVRGERTLRQGDLVRMGDQLLRFETTA